MTDRLVAEPLFAGEDFAVRVEPAGVVTDAAAWLDAHLEQIEALARAHAVVLLRGIGVSSEEDFLRIRSRLLPRPAAYLNRSTPRSEVAEGIHTATEYPATEEILLHCENAYQHDWPMRLVFCCLHPAESGGQTTVADMRLVSQRIGTAELEEFAHRGVQYIRHFYPEFDIPWTTAFQTTDRAAVGSYCAAEGIDCAWLPGDVLRTRQRCQGVARHPLTGEVLWFNQAHLFHPSALGPGMLADLVDVFGADALPRDARFGDGQPIPADRLARVRGAFQSSARHFDWQAGDVMIVDNMLAAHGRRPFTGRRRVLVSFGNLMSEALADIDRNWRAPCASSS